MMRASPLDPDLLCAALASVVHEGMRIGVEGFCLSPDGTQVAVLVSCSDDGYIIIVEPASRAIRFQRLGMVVTDVVWPREDRLVFDRCYPAPGGLMRLDPKVVGSPATGPFEQGSETTELLDASASRGLVLVGDTRPFSFDEPSIVTAVHVHSLDTGERIASLLPTGFPPAPDEESADFRSGIFTRACFTPAGIEIERLAFGRAPQREIWDSSLRTRVSGCELWPRAGDTEAAMRARLEATPRAEPRVTSLLHAAAGVTLDFASYDDACAAFLRTYGTLESHFSHLHCWCEIKPAALAQPYELHRSLVAAVVAWSRAPGDFGLHPLSVFLRSGDAASLRWDFGLALEGKQVRLTLPERALGEPHRFLALLSEMVGEGEVTKGAAGLFWAGREALRWAFGRQLKKMSTEAKGELKAMLASQRGVAWCSAFNWLTVLRGPARPRPRRRAERPGLGELLPGSALAFLHLAGARWAEDDEGPALPPSAKEGLEDALRLEAFLGALPPGVVAYELPHGATLLQACDEPPRATTGRAAEGLTRLEPLYRTLEAHGSFFSPGGGDRYAEWFLPPDHRST